MIRFLLACPIPTLPPNSCAPVLAELTTSKRVAVPAALFDDLPPEWRAQHHIYYDRRVMDVPDGLAKFRTNFGGEKCDDRGDSLPPAPD